GVGSDSDFQGFYPSVRAAPGQPRLELLGPIPAFLPGIPLEGIRADDRGRHHREERFAVRAVRYCALLLACLLAGSVPGWASAEAEARVLDYIRTHLQPGQPLKVTDLYN